jgi:hypothetical protein
VHRTHRHIVVACARPGVPGWARVACAVSPSIGRSSSRERDALAYRAIGHRRSETCTCAHAHVTCVRVCPAPRAWSGFRAGESRENSRVNRTSRSSCTFCALAHRGETETDCAGERCARRRKPYKVYLYARYRYNPKKSLSPRAPRTGTKRIARVERAEILPDPELNPQPDPDIYRCIPRPPPKRHYPGGLRAFFTPAKLEPA